MKKVNATLFRLTFLDLEEPVEVTHFGEPRGTYTPYAPGSPVGVAVSPKSRPKPVDLTRRA